jgi:hypothetical protein
VYFFLIHVKQQPAGKLTPTVPQPQPAGLPDAAGCWPGGCLLALLLAPTPLAARSSNLPRPEAGRTGILGGSRCG